MAIYHIKRDNKLYGPFSIEQVAKCINTNIFTSKDSISEDQINWKTIEEFKSQKSKETNSNNIFLTQPSVNLCQPEQNITQNSYMQPNVYPQGNQNFQQCCKSKRTFVFLGLFLGALGVHYFYAGYMLWGFLMLLFSIVANILLHILNGNNFFGLVAFIIILGSIYSTKTDANGIPFVLYPTKRAVYLLLCLFFGYLGFHHFYAGYIGKGLIQYAINYISFVIALILEAVQISSPGIIMLGWLILIVIYHIITFVLACCEKNDAEDREFI